MNKKKINHIYENKGMWYVRYKDPHSYKWKGISTGIKAFEKNLKLAKDYRDEFLKKLREIERYEFKEGSLQDAFNKFYALNSNKASSTQGTYMYFWDYFKQFFDVNQPCLVINKMEAEKFLNWLQTLKNLSNNTQFGIQKNFIKFLNFLFEYEYLPKIFRINKDAHIKRRELEPIIFSDKDRKKIIDSLDKEKKNLNFKLLVNLLMYSGQRPSNIKSLTKNQIDLKRMEVRFYSSKTGNWFVRPIHPKLKPILKKRLSEIDAEAKLFNYAEEKNMGKAFSRYIKDIGLGGKNYNLRTFRKDFISRGQEAGVPINVAALLVGHKNIKTTMTYYTKLSSDYLKNELKKVI